jgi:hypothetical protein
VTAAINRCLDGLPRGHFLRYGREISAYRAAGVTGYYVALGVALLAALVTKRSLLVVALLAAVCAGAFYGYTYLRRWITGRERLVLLEHVWAALAACAATLAVLREPLGPYLDIVAAAMCFFLAGGRAGCMLVGCCHGQPASVGIVYGDEFVAHGFPAYFRGVRLLPVPALEMAGLIAIGSGACVGLPFAPPGAVLAGVLISYAVMRFALEGLRGDERPHLFGLSQGRWMSLVEVAAVAWWSEVGQGTARQPIAWALAAGLAIIVVARYWRNPRRRMLAEVHVSELRATASRESSPDLRLQHTALGIRVGISTADTLARETHLSLSLPKPHRDFALLCELAVRAFPEITADAAHWSGEGVLHLLVPLPLGQARGPRRPARGRALYGELVRRSQQGPPPKAELRGLEMQKRPWYFTASGG